MVKNKWNFIYHIIPFISFFLALQTLASRTNQYGYYPGVFAVFSLLLVLFNAVCIMNAVNKYSTFFTGLLPNLFTWIIAGVIPFFFEKAIDAAWTSFLIFVFAAVMTIIYFECTDQ